MPTADDLAALATALYVGNPSVGVYDYKGNLDFDEKSTTAIALGLTPPFYLWSDEEDSGDAVYYRNFNSMNTLWHHGARFNSDNYVICRLD